MPTSALFKARLRFLHDQQLVVNVVHANTNSLCVKMKSQASAVRASTSMAVTKIAEWLAITISHLQFRVGRCISYTGNRSEFVSILRYRETRETATIFTVATASLQ